MPGVNTVSFVMYHSVRNIYVLQFVSRYMTGWYGNASEVHMTEECLKKVGTLNSCSSKISELWYLPIQKIRNLIFLEMRPGHIAMSRDYIVKSIYILRYLSSDMTGSYWNALVCRTYSYLAISLHITCRDGAAVLSWGLVSRETFWPMWKETLNEVFI